MLGDNLPTNAEEFKKIQDAILSKEISVVNTSERKMYFSLGRNYEVIIIDLLVLGQAKKFILV